MARWLPQRTTFNTHGNDNATLDSGRPPSSNGCELQNSEAYEANFSYALESISHKNRDRLKKTLSRSQRDAHKTDSEAYEAKFSNPRRRKTTKIEVDTVKFKAGWPLKKF
ncbi:unnamed protein product [Ceratitis capitata]|uniref:(Mediterranean fruit fly) hypothetical protein n=1 Tax=Ceratitis capitata TaxID=7213 RepID=A0A811V9F5_CERCA|nr:unnamed protein product [Ceratitis capitata]